MKTTLISFVLLALAFSASAKPAKRFAGFGQNLGGGLGGALGGSLSAVGGGLGCVVTGNKLYINGLYSKDLTGAEQEELSAYAKKIDAFKKEVREAIEVRRQQVVASRKSGGNAQAALAAAADNSSLPQPPEKPSFCSADVTTQYIFDGCKVQNNKVYVGGEYARDLSSDEVAKLKVFDKQMTAYQQQLSTSLQAQVKEIFGDQLAQLFGTASRRVSKNGSSKKSELHAAATTPATPLEAPEAPNFCTIIF